MLLVPCVPPKQLWPTEAWTLQELWRCPVASGTKTLAADPFLSPVSCEVESPWIRLVVPAHPKDARSGEFGKNTEAAKHATNRFSGNNQKVSNIWNSCKLARKQTQVHVVPTHSEELKINHKMPPIGSLEGLHEESNQHIQASGVFQTSLELWSGETKIELFSHVHPQHVWHQWKQNQCFAMAISVCGPKPFRKHVVWIEEGSP